MARSSTNLLGFPAGTRIATPVCALVRNDMQILARCQRLQGRFSGSKPAVPRYYAGRRQISTCHCKEQSDGTIRSPAVGHSKEQYFGQIRKASRIRPKWYQLARLLCGENGLPHQCAHWFAMTDLVGVCEFAQTAANLPGSSAGRTDCHASVRTGSQ